MERRLLTFLTSDGLFEIVSGATDDGPGGAPFSSGGAIGGAPRDPSAEGGGLLDPQHQVGEAAYPASAPHMGVRRRGGTTAILAALEMAGVGAGKLALPANFLVAQKLPADPAPHRNPLETLVVDRSTISYPRVPKVSTAGKAT
jgi:hypothetical protein